MNGVVQGDRVTGALLKPVADSEATAIIRTMGLMLLSLAAAEVQTVDTSGHGPEAALRNTPSFCS